MPTRCTEAATCSGIRNSWPPGCRHAGKPDKPDRTSGRPPALLRPSRSPKSPRPECASVSPWGLAKLADEIWRPAAVRTFFEGLEGRRTLPTSGFAVLPWHYGLNALGPLKVRNGAAGNQHRTPMRWPGSTGNMTARKSRTHQRPSQSRAGHSGAGFGPRAFPGLLIFQFSDRGSTP